MHWYESTNAGMCTLERTGYESTNGGISKDWV